MKERRKRIRRKNSSLKGEFKKVKTDKNRKRGRERRRRKRKNFSVLVIRLVFSSPCHYNEET